MTDVLIIGGGIIGLLVAREMRQAGAQVTILERNPAPAQESSWAGGGIISPLYPWRYPDSVTRLAAIGHDVYPTLCGQLLQDTGIDPEYTRSGLFIHAGEEKNAALRWARRWNHRISVEDRQGIEQLEPARQQPPAQLLWLPDIGQVRNPRLVKALVEDLRQRKVAIHTNTSVTGFTCGSRTLTRIHTTSGNFQADNIILCAGAWTGELGQSLPVPPRIHPVRGQMLLFKGKPGLIRHMMLEEDRYIIPRRDGHVLFGSTLEEAAFDKITTEAARQELEQLAIQRFPLLADYPVVKHWAGLRPAAPGGIPYICQHPELENLYMNAGQYRNGVVLAPASARLLRNLLTGETPVVDPSPYTLDATRA